MKNSVLQRSCKRYRGFTLIELMVTVAIGVTLMVVAAPSFIQMKKNSALSDAVSNFIVATATAKSAALSSGKNTFLVANVAAQGWQSGWFVYRDNNWNAQYDAGTDDVLLTHDAISSDILITAPNSTALSENYLMFDGSGFPRKKTGGIGNPNGTLVLATDNRSSSVVVDTAGRVRSCTTGSTGCSAL